MKEIINRLNSIKAYCKLMNRKEQSIQWQKDIEATNEQTDRLTNAISVYILTQSCGYMEYLRGECQ